MAIAPEINIAPFAAKEPNHSLLKVGVDLLSLDGDQTALPSAEEIKRFWEAGVTFNPESCDTGGLFAACPTDYDQLGGESTCSVDVIYIPFVVWAHESDSSWSRGAKDLPGRALRKLHAIKSYRLEQEFWNGTLAQAEGLPNPYLANGATSINAGIAIPLVYALSELQDALGDCLTGGSGMIHAPRRVVNTWVSAHVVKAGMDDKGVLRFHDVFGNEIVAGSGYDGSAPDGSIDATHSTAWVYGTGPVGVSESPVRQVPDTEKEALNRAINDITYNQTITVAAVFDPCCHFGVNVDVCNACCTGDIITPQNG